MINIIKPELLGNRLDADFYKKDFIENELILSNLGSITLSNLIDTKKSGYGVLPKSDEYLDNGLPLIRGGDLSFGRVQEIGVFVPEYYKDSRAIAKTGDVLILIKGACIDGPEGVARVGEAENGYLYNGSCYRLSFKQPELDGYFFIAYSQSKFFLKQKKRQVANTGISYNDESSILNYLIPNLSPIVKKYIGDKVRQAEILRDWAKNLEKVFSEILISFCSNAVTYTPSGKKHSLAPLHEISHTLNPGAFNEKRLFIRKKLRELDAKTLKDVVDIYSPTTNEYTENTSYIGLDAINSNSCEITSSTVKASGVVGTARVLYEGVVISKLRPYLNKVSYIPKVFEGAVGSTELLCLKAKNNSISNWYLYGVLKSDLVLNQLEPLSTGSTHPRIDRYDIYDLIIPILPNNHELGDNLQKAQNGYLYSQKLLKMSTSLVESVIDGIISEEELIQAQHALEQGDTSLDRAILSQMIEEGYAVAGSKPLFTDLDEFYVLLEQAKALE